MADRAMQRPVRAAGWIIALCTTLLPGSAAAHTFGQSYVLPIPLALYGWSAAAALLISFIAASWFLRDRHLAVPPERSWPADHFASRTLLLVLQLAALGMLCLTIASGWFGPANRNHNLSMPLFWMVFVLAFAYLNAFVGGLYERVNPWRTLVLALGWLVRPLRRGLFAYPFRWLGYWPAVLLYLMFIWVELFGHTKPASLALWLLGYTGVNLFGSLLFGARAWFRYGEFFGVFLRVVSLIAPVTLERSANDRWQWRLRWQFAGLLGRTPDHGSLVFFIVCMLATTAYDGFHETVPWLRFFWSTFIPWWDPDIGLRALILYRPWMEYYMWLGLPLACLFYYALYVLAVWLGRTLARSDIELGTLLRSFGYTLVPIALVYHASHYYTLLQTDGIRVIALLSDPFGRGWDLFGTRETFRYTVIPQMDVTWHSQVALIILGHLIGVLLAHREALRIFGNRRQASLSQIPMLGLMVLYTVAGLWILALPIQTARFL